VGLSTLAVATADIARYHFVSKAEKRIVIYGKRRVFDGFFKIDEVELSYERYDGKMSPPVKRLCFERGDSVTAILFNPECRKLLFVKQFKYPTYEKGPGWIVETVAGILEPGETPEAALRRETLEETGYEISLLEPIATFYVSPGGSSERILLYYAEVLKTGKVGAGGGVTGENEDIKTVEYSPEELDHALASGEIQDAKTIIGIQWWQTRFKHQERR
jgi:nudix-type nucleoside diphosphatase (YffH/AdpP family)